MAKRRKSSEVQEFKEHITKAKSLKLGEDLQNYMVEALTVAYDFCYPVEVSENILKCTNEGQISSIMSKARHSYV